MFDIRWIRDNPDAFDAGLAKRGLPAQASHVLDLDSRRRSAITELQEAQARRNEASKQIGAAKSKGEDADALIAEVAALKQRIQQVEADEACRTCRKTTCPSARTRTPTSRSAGTATNRA